MAKNEISAAEKYRQERKERLAKAAKKNAKRAHKVHLSEKAKSVVAVLVVVAIFIGIGVPLGIKGYNNSATKEQKIAVMTYKGTEISKPVYSYFVTRMFNNVYSYAQQYAQYGIDMGYDTTLTPGEQAYTSTLEGYENPTWLDYFDYSAKETIKQIEVYCEKAAELGLTLDEERKTQLEENMSDLKESAESYSVSENVFLQSSYGKGVTKALVRELIEKQLLAEIYMEHMQNEYKDGYTEKQLNKYYNANKETYEVVSLRYYKVEAATESVASTDEDGNETTNDVVTDATMAEAKKTVQAFASLKTEEEFKKAAAKLQKKVDKETADDYLTDDTKTLNENATRSDLSDLSEKALTWAFSADKGSVYIDENADSGYTAYMIATPAGKDMSEDKTYDVRHILVMFTEDEEAESDTETEETADTTEETTEETTEAVTEAVEETVDVKTLDVNGYGDTVIDLAVDADSAKDKQAYKKAQDILVEYLKGKKTEDAFAELATKYTEDTGSTETGGLYEDVTLGQMVPEFEAWSVKDGRKTGDVGIVEHDGGESGYSGYHIMYSVAVNSNGTAWEYSVKSAKADEDFTTFSEDLLKQEEYAITVTNEEEVQNALSFVTTLAENAASSSTSY